MRLPESSSSNGGAFAEPVRGRDSLSSVQSPSSFFRPSVDFTSIFRGNGVPSVAAPNAGESAPVSPSSSPSPNKSTAEISQAESGNEAVQPWDEEEDEAIAEKNALTVEPLALVVDAPLKSAPPVVGADPQAAQTAEKQSDPQAVSPTETPLETATATPATADSAAATDPAPLAANKDASENVGQTTETSGERATLPTPMADVEKTSSEVTGDAGEMVSSASNQDQQTDRSPAQIAAENRGETIRRDRDASTDAELAAQTQNRNALAGNDQSTLASDGEDASNRNSGRQGRGRTGGSARQLGRAAQAAAVANTRNEAATPETDSAVSQAGPVGASPASGSTDNAPITEPGAVELAPAPGETSAFADPAVSGPVAGGSETVNRPSASGGQSSELGAIGTSSSTDSGRSGDRSAARADENLSRTDIADRARLIHRISKAFTKMGTDGGQIRMKMHPETLGGVLLEMRVRGRNVEATVTADNEAARGVLQQQLSELRQRLESQGMTVQRLEVVLRDDSATGGSLLRDHRGEMFGGDRGSDGNGQSRRPPGSGNTTKTNDSSSSPGGGWQSGGGGNARTLSPAAPGTLDLRL